MDLKLAIIADDLTGANDSSVQFSTKGLNTAVAIPGADISCIKNIEVLVLDCESRDIPKDNAYSAVFSATKKLLKLNNKINIYKKVDSTLRGNIGAELEALYKAYEPYFIVFAPAFIEGGRTTIHGYQYLHGKKLEETELANIPKSPVTSSFIPEIIAKQTNLKTAILDLSVINQGVHAIENSLQKIISSDIKIVISDAKKIEDLDLLVNCLQKYEKVIYAGSAGLAKSLSKFIQSSKIEDVIPKAKKILVLAGSISAVTRSQCKNLLNLRNVKLFAADPVETIKKTNLYAQKVSRQIINMQKDTDVILVCGAFNENDVHKSSEAGSEIGLNFFECGERIACFMASLMNRCADYFDAFILTGGDTAIHACNSCDANILKILKEIEPGIPLLKIAYGKQKEKYVITKAGAFGNPLSLVNSVKVLSNSLKRTTIMKKPTIGLTMGDPAGIGSEIIIKSLQDPQIYEKARPVVFGDAKQLKRLIKILKLNIDVHKINNIKDASPSINRIEVVDLDNVPEDIPFGQINPICGNAAFEYIEAAIKAHLAHQIQAIVTAPLNKEALHAGGHNFPGHTEILATLTGTKDYSMMLVSPKLRVIHVSTHVSLRGACDACKKERVYRVIKLADDTLKLMGFENPRIAVSGLNPHCGEHGLFGNEDIEEIVPAVEKAQGEGINVQGPIAPDTVFHRAANKNEFDIVVVQYHDQGHIPLKVLGFSSGVNITVGLPIIRTSVDHGTAFEIAGKGIADSESMTAAMEIGAQMASVKFANELI